MEHVEITRDCWAIQIPSGRAVKLERGTAAIVTQALGGSVTVQVPVYGCLFRIAAADADAVGRAARPQASPGSGGERLEERVWAQLRTCYDPEIPLNIVDLGLVYDMRITTLPDGESRIEVKMTLTAPGCGMGDSIAAEARHKLAALPGVSAVSVDLVWEPPWSPERITPEGRERLGLV
jgi:probable FeS assembly SUF system protein SufT